MIYDSRRKCVNLPLNSRSLIVFEKCLHICCISRIFYHELLFDLQVFLRNVGFEYTLSCCYLFDSFGFLALRTDLYLVHGGLLFNLDPCFITCFIA